MIVILPKEEKSVLHAEQSKLRGSILYNDGERPEFLSCNNIPVDDDNLDYGSYHLLQLYRDEVR